MKKRTKRSAARAVGLGVVGFTAMHNVQATTEITFGGFTANNIDISTIGGYGSNVSSSSADYNVSAGATGVTGTPNIALTWGTGYQTYTAWDGRGNVAQTDFTQAGAPQEILLTLTPQAGSGVLVNSFALDEWAGGGDANVNWQLADSVGTLASGAWTRNTGGRDVINTGLTLGDVRLGEAVTLKLTRISGEGSYLALDNLVFDQVPEPSTIALGLMGLGLGAAAMRRGRK
jgi:hypothetical protein